ncbi:MAG: hypothetical protein Q7S58_16915 [Candidatus Binatus sp.]|uniref:hypothetical protein n=1 Tax=Candidatus Binatus sp. TaxID=2811406 RepID=UPI002726811A|nr:hypothetical protein [Candidatus Binatus sp.]MDO8434081.1 hypothetical protein [Candidatus Binatus sp.]
MDESSGIGKVLRDITRAYEDGLSTIGNAISDLGKRRIPDAERQVERWISMARSAKDGYVAAIDQSFTAWERQVRNLLTPSKSQSDKEGKPESKRTASQLESWIEEWRTANESFTKSLRESGLGKEAIKQAKEYRKTFEDGLKNLQKMWQSAIKNDRK